jgi:threonine synthase
VNDAVPEFLKTGNYQPKNTIATISNAMDVGDPNNFVRILEIFEEDISELKRILSAYSISDDETKTIIKTVYKEHKYLLDPHGAVGYLSLERYLQNNREQKARLSGGQGFFVETAHPVKFYDVVERLIGEKIPLPSSVAEIMDKNKVATKMDVVYSFLKEFLLKL